MRPCLIAIGITAICNRATAFTPICPRVKALRTVTAASVEDKTERQQSTDVIEPSLPKAMSTLLEDKQYWEVAATLNRPASSLTPELQNAVEKNVHPTESQEELGEGKFMTQDWRRAWYTYQSPLDNHDLIDPVTGQAEYMIDEIEGYVPDDLVGVLYRNGPGKFGVNGERVQHVLDADGLIVQVTFPPPRNGEPRQFAFRSRFVETEFMKDEEESQKFLYRGTFGTGPSGFLEPPKNGLNEDPWQEPLPSKIVGNAFKTDIKNSANTQVISFGGKVLALFEAGLPHRIDPNTLETLGEDDLGGTLPRGTPVKVGQIGDFEIPEEFLPDFLGGAAHTAHPQMCPDTGNLVGWHWSQIVNDNSLEATFTEWSASDFSPIASSTFRLPGCELAPHDMALTENCMMLKVNSLTMNQGDFIMGLSGPAASLKMDGRANVQVHVFPRPTAKNQFEPYVVEVPPCFSIHFSHAYEDPESGNLVSFFSGWPPSDSKDFLGAWGGFAPYFAVIPETFIWKLVIDPRSKKCVSLDIAPGALNACAEHPLVHPKFSTKKAKYVYAVGSNVVGDSSAPCGYVKLRVEESDDRSLKAGEKNEKIDAYWFGSRFFAGEPIIVPKAGSNPEIETEAYLLGMVQDSVKDRSAVAIFDLDRDLQEGPVAMLWLKSSIPHGLHGCFSAEGKGGPSVFC